MSLFEAIGSNYIYISLGIIASALSFVLSIVILIFGSRVRKELLWRAEIKEFNNCREDYKNKILGLRENVIKHNILDEKLISDILVIINIYSDYKQILNIKDKYEIYAIKRYLARPKERIVKQVLCNKISYFSSRLERDREVL